MAYSPTACLVVTIVLQVLVLVAIALRLYVRVGVKGNIAADDYMAVLATVRSNRAPIPTSSAVYFFVLGANTRPYFKILYTGLSLSYIIAMANYGVAHPGLRVSSEQAATGLLLVLIGEILYLTATYLVKVSIAFTLFRIVTAKPHRYTIYTLLLIGAILTTITCFWAFFLCSPVNYFWDRFRGAVGSCKSIRTLMAVHFVQASWTLISDLTLGLVIPGLVLWDSLMERRTKILVWFLLGFGSLAAIATIVRMIYLPTMTITNSPADNHIIVLWSVLEAAIGIICSAAATWRPLVSRLRRSPTGSCEPLGS
ncbi:hypothetical protein ASPCAL00358 [Aspergillus calidoustus]|uniref:Rhodopsin domain-containing protein n=1 Tax=Aspergillus calidoustus TaxID=454130 RepID=A0A0U5C0Z9_ASPCI|nr:hypothetical protein ASPCAL00358 [Aspergillus calidoustus]